jgi:predicted secreted protein
MRIHTDHNGVAVNAISQDAHGKDVLGHTYQVLAGPQVTSIEFQNGPVKEAGVNGLTSEALLAVLIHRTQVLNSRFSCRENAIAVTKMEEALMWFNKRTADRQARSVEGKNEA